VRLCRSARDSEFAYSDLEGRSIYPKECRRTMGTCNNPVALLKGAEDVPTLRFLQNAMKCPVCRGLWSSGSLFYVHGLGRFKSANVNT
jgi:hypothetical protein